MPPGVMREGWGLRQMSTEGGGLQKVNDKSSNREPDQREDESAMTHRTNRYLTGQTLVEARKEARQELETENLSSSGQISGIKGQKP